ncbi:hypothetical protein [Pontimicrobium sp. MEBiC01747]
MDVDPKGKIKIDKVREEFEGVISQARQIHKTDKIKNNTIKKACDTCNPLLKYFNILEVFD